MRMKSDGQIVTLNTFRRTISFTDPWQAACSDSGRSEADLDIEVHPTDQERAGLYEDVDAAHNQHLVQNCHLSELESEPDQTDALAVDIDIDCDKSTGAHEAKELSPDEGDGSAETSTT
jgi:hypothetical protein